MSQELQAYRFERALELIRLDITAVDAAIEEKKPWSLDGDALKESLTFFVDRLRSIATDLQPFLPKTAATVLTQFAGPTIVSQQPLFPRLV